MKQWLQAWRDEPVLMWRLWKSRYFPYRTAELLDVTDDGEMLFGSWKWHRPDVLK